MTLRVMLPDRELFSGPVVKVVADGVAGGRGFLPRHADMAMALKPGVLTCTDAAGAETFFAVHGGVLVKKRAELTVATRQAVMADSLEKLADGVLAQFAAADAYARAADETAVRLETVLLREFLELNR